MKAALVICATTLAVGAVSLAQSKPSTSARVYVGSDSLAHVIDDEGKDTMIQKRIRRLVARQKYPPTGRQQVGWLNKKTVVRLIRYPLGLLSIEPGKHGSWAMA